MATLIKTRAILSEAMERFNHFKRGNLHANHWNGWQFGQLPQEYQIQLKDAYADNMVYVVYSYQTPIAWSKCDGKHEWVIPPVLYSVTTSHHQGLVMVEADDPGFYARMYESRQFTNSPI